ncbi:MAG: cupin domain-containing protein [Chloroflexota bacterium]|nr:cupin domain-containing protein [Chloroflexota bacterium]
MSNRARHVPHEQLELLSGPVTKDGGELRQLSGSDYDLHTSVMHAQVAPGSGPRRHRHPHAEIFVLHFGQGRFEVDGEFIDAVAGDMVIIPPDAWHSFVNTGDELLRQTAIHENPRAVTLFEDGSRRD